MIDYSPKACLKRTNEQLVINSETTDRYACLELRQCIEALAYKKLRAYENRLPQSIFDTWQPQQVISFLTELEPNSELDKKVVISRQNFDGQKSEPICSFNQKEITAKFISKRYHKLGSYLHTPIKPKEITSKKLHDYLVKLASELTEYVNTTTYSTLAITTNFDCIECEQKICRNVASLKDGDIVKCFNNNCQAQHIVEYDGDLLKFELHQAKFECDCSGMIFISSHKIKENGWVACSNCGAKYIFSMGWQVEKCI
jgi:hypothetical protein